MAHLFNELNIVARIDGGSRNHIDLGSMFGFSCKQVKTEFLVIHNEKAKQGIIRIDSEPEPFEKIIAPFSDSLYLTENAKCQFVPFILPNRKMGLFDCRSSRNILKNYDEIEIILSNQQKSNLMRDDFYLSKPNLFRAILCRVGRNNKFGLISILSIDSSLYGFGNPDFGAETKLRVELGVIYESISYDEIHRYISAITYDGTAKELCLSSARRIEQA